MAYIAVPENIKYSILVPLLSSSFILLYFFSSLQIDLTFDEETRHYTNLTEHFTLFADNLIHICGRNFNGYIQDVSEDLERQISCRLLIEKIFIEIV